MTGRPWRSAVPLVLSGLLAIGGHMHGYLEIVLPAVPLLMLVISLLIGLYPGCDAIVRFAEWLDSRQRRPRIAASRRRPPEPVLHRRRGGLLIALGLAQRPPPFAL